MGLNRIVSLFAEAVLPDCNRHLDKHQRQHYHDDRDNDDDNDALRRRIRRDNHHHHRSPDVIFIPGSSSVFMYSSELDIHGTTARFRKSLLWSSLRKPRKPKGSSVSSGGQLCDD